jgi:hypothetical protein
LEKLGCLVIRNEELDTEDIDLTEEVEELKACTDKIELDFSVEIPEPVKLSK